MKTTQSLRLIIAVSAFLMVASSVVMSSAQTSEAEDLAILAIENAETSVGTAYAAVSAAEAAGADIALALDRLNVGIEYLALANVYLRTNDFYNAAQHANLCVDALAGISEDADALGSSVKAESDIRSSMVAMLSIVGVAFVVCTSMLSWRLFKRTYCRRLLKKEVVVAQ